MQLPGTRCYVCTYLKGSSQELTCWAASTMAAAEQAWVLLNAPDPMCVDVQVREPEEQVDDAFDLSLASDLTLSFGHYSRAFNSW